ncbi:hypothetical protein KAT08_02725 [Candidatus Babeliales bacterium]|nr:hypothetical protein [Candidatus Babeliales bacterium]
MNLILIFLLYQVLQLILSPLLIAILIKRKIKKKITIGSFKERFGFVPKTKKNKKIIWIHAVSVGEILSVQNVIENIKQKVENSDCFLTTGTISGKKIAQQNITSDYLSFLPFDFLIPMLIAFKRIKPAAIIIIEAETWPNFLMLAKFFSIPIYSLNARISTRSKKRYLNLKIFLRPLFNIFKIIFVQSQEDKKNFEKLKINPFKIKTLGNIKTFNVLSKKEKLEKFKIFKIEKLYKTLLVGSLHSGELEIYLNLFKNIKKEFSNIKLILAPRHFHWQNELIKKVKSTGYKYYLWQKDEHKNLSEFINKKFEIYDILLVCKLGELFKLYQMSDLFFLGGTFVPVGGHNLLEPSVWSNPSIIGLYNHNCKDIANKLEKQNAIIKIKNQDKLLLQTKHLLKNPDLAKSIGQNAQKWLLSEAKIVQKNLKILWNELI